MTIALAALNFASGRRELGHLHSGALLTRRSWVPRPVH